MLEDPGEQEIAVVRNVEGAPDGNARTPFHWAVSIGPHASPAAVEDNTNKYNQLLTDLVGP